MSIKRWGGDVKRRRKVAPIYLGDVQFHSRYSSPGFLTVSGSKGMNIFC